MKRAALLLVFPALMGGCASSGKAPLASMPPPQTPAEARQQMEQLERMIEDNRVALGLPARQEPEQTQARHAAPAAPSAGGAEAPRPESADDAVTYAPEPCAPAPAAKASARMEERHYEDRPTCTPGCRYAKAICGAAERICNLARYLGEPDARHRCQRAQQDCRAARRATAAQACDEC